MDLVFTDYVRVLDVGHEPPAEQFDAVRKKLRDGLRKEMIRRALWSAPPSYLGICGWSSWSPEALEDLSNDCYCFNFVRRLAGLQALLQIQDNIEGVVFLNIRYFLFEKQKAHDPVGYRVFRVLQTALRKSMDAGALYVLAGEPKVGNSTVLAFSSRPDQDRARPEDLKEWVRVWADELRPELVTARGKKLDAVVERLCGYLVELAGVGIESFLFKDLIDPFKQAVRLRWNAMGQNSGDEMAYESSDDEFVDFVPLVQPNTDFEEREAFQQLIVCVEEALDRVNTRKKTRVYLEKLWIFLRNHAADPSVSKWPSLRRIAVLLKISRPRLPELLKTLGRLTETCRREG